MFADLKKKIAAKVFGLDKNKKRDIPSYPLELHRDALAEIKTSTSLIYGSEVGKHKKSRVLDIGVIKIADSTIYRYYFPYDHMLQLIIDNKGNEEELRLYKEMKSYYPSTPEDWEDFERRMSSFKFSFNGKEYTRMESWADPDPEYVDLVDFTEKRSNKELVKYSAMCFGRWLSEEDGVAEYLLVSVESRQSFAGEDLVRIVVHLGIDVSTPEVKVYY